MKKVNIIGALVLVTAVILSTVWYDWKLALLIFLFVMGNNMERSGKNKC